MELRSLSHIELVTNTKMLVSQEKKLEIDIILHLQEIKRRRLDAARGYFGIGDFCEKALGLSKDAAWKRSQVVNVVIFFPCLLEMLKEGKTHMSHIAMLAPKVTHANADKIIGFLPGKSRRDLEFFLSTINSYGDVVDKEEEIEIKIPAGISAGEMVRMTGMGEAVSGGQSGDLYIKINVKSHALFKRDGQNLTTDLPIKLSDALLGMTYDLKTLEGNIVEVKIPEGINHGELLRVKGKGVPSGHGRGDIILRIQIKMPNKISKKGKELVEELKKEGI